MTMDVALPRARVRFRPPNPRRVYDVLMVVLLLGFIAHAMVEMAAGHAGWLVNLGLWMWNYIYYRRSRDRDYQRANRAGLPLPPVSRWQWGWLGFLVAVQAADWIGYLRWTL